MNDGPATDANGNPFRWSNDYPGNWDANNNKINSGSNKAGTICATYSNGACQDAAKVKDFFIMADGTNVQSTSSNGGWTTMTGTSMAVSWSLAVLLSDQDVAAHERQASCATCAGYCK